MAQQFKTLLNSDRELLPLLAKSQALSALHRHFVGVAPPYLAQSSQVLGLQSGVLSVAVANAAAAAKLRQLVPELVVMLRNRGCEVSGIRVKVQVSYERSPSASTHRKLGKTARDAISELNQTLDDSPLRRSLERLAGRKE